MTNKNYIEVEGIKLTPQLIGFLKELQMNNNEAVRDALHNLEELSGLLLDLTEITSNECLKRVKEIHYYKTILESINV